ncbi:ent-copalyl diphosphate synthase 1, chloroplastic [Iris pallida]|uniref:Ent-copalyl diphosphate synthase 1, chloroplastic n=1 Tax=Iris pallida TaxID=29817 RepID=A0AAX6GVX4_IRIPA|nr:ent-copalyl diphosphate synthase 1, chloroplastic [Iris pallida]
MILHCKIYAKRKLKLRKIPKEIMHEVPTTLLHSIEGMPGLDWKRLLKLQSADGSFLFSPSSTAYALGQTRDEKCFGYLQRAVEKFDGGVPNVYPVDLFEHIWAVDRLERLGISRYFETEIRECLDYVYRYWTDNGICWARNSRVQDVDDTAMGFRLLRLNGYDVSPDVLRNFEKDGEFFCFVGQSNQAVTGMYNLNRASQVMFPGEHILDRAYKFSYRFLREKQAHNQLLDKWIITKDLPGEVGYTLDFPFCASLPRVEARWFLEQYGGRNDTWIGKTLYRMPLVNNDLYLELAKADFNRCQATHQMEWLHIQKWYEECGLESLGVSRKSALTDYFLAAACVFEPERAAERIGWAKTSVLAKAVASYLGSKTCSEEERERFISELGNSGIRLGGKKTGGLVGSILQLIDDLVSWDGWQHRQQHQQNIQIKLRHAWEEWILTRIRKEEHAFEGDETGLLLVRTVELCRGQSDPLANPDYDHLASLTSSICQQLAQLPEGNQDGENAMVDEAIKRKMQEMLQCVLQNSGGLNDQTNQTFLSVAKSYCYASCCPPATLSTHISKVLFEQVA